MSLPAARLEVTKLAAHYGRVRVLRDVDLHVDEGEIVALVGANGAGKSTLLRCLAGLHQGWTGRALLGRQELAGLPAHRLAALGISLVPEGRELFAGLSVADNLRVGLYSCVDPDAAEGRDRVSEVLALFPMLRDHLTRPAGSLSGGQQQMLALARALVRRPSLLLLDEPSLGLAPLVVADIFAVLGELRGKGVAVLVAEQNARAALGIANRAYVMENGRITRTAKAADLLADEEVGRHYLGSDVELQAPSEPKSLPDLVGVPLLSPEDRQGGAFRRRGGHDDEASDEFR